MSTIITGNRFLGYGRTLHCSHCGNRVTEHVLMPFTEVGVFYFSISTTRSIHLLVICPICHVQTLPEKAGFETLFNSLEAGKAFTKRYVDEKYTSKQKNTLIKDLNKLGFKMLSAYLDQK